MVKYRVSKYITIHEMNNDYDAVPVKYLTGYFIMRDKNYDSEYLINATIKYYIDKFSIPKTEKEVLKEIEQDVQSQSEEIRDACSRFFKFLCKVKILIPGNKPEEVITDEPLYKKGDIIGDLRILTLLSGRHYTDIYSATDTTNGCVYVLKLLNRKKAANITRYQKELAEMELEYKMLQQASHIHPVIRAHNFRKIQDQGAYIVLEYINGKSLSGYMEDEAAMLTNSCCLQIIEAIINAFSCLHASNIIHGDIHSSNILITKEKEVRIIDLGMARNVEIEENEVVKSGGVYFYMPPERINITSFKKFSKDPDLFSDVYQVGLLIYLVLYNSLPFEGFTWEELAQSIKEDDVAYPDVSFLNYPVPFQLADIIKKCLDKEPLKRYAGASGILADFKKYSFVEKELAEI